MTAPNRRRAPRIPQRLPIHLRADTEELMTETENISVSGAYCTVTRFLSPMTKLQVRLEIPGPLEATTISCEAAVVRIEPAKPVADRSEYQVAVFFTDLSERDQAALTRYVQQHLQPTP